MISGDSEAAAGIGFFVAVLWTLADGVAWFLARRMASPISSHAAQAFWWAFPALIAFVVLVALSGTTALGFAALVGFAAFGALGAYRVVQGEGHRYPGIAALVEGRR